MKVQINRELVTVDMQPFHDSGTSCKALPISRGAAPNDSDKSCTAQSACLA